MPRRFMGRRWVRIYTYLVNLVTTVKTVKGFRQGLVVRLTYYTMVLIRFVYGSATI